MVSIFSSKSSISEGLGSRRPRYVSSVRALQLQTFTSTVTQILQSDYHLKRNLSLLVNENEMVYDISTHLNGVEEPMMNRMVFEQ